MTVADTKTTTVKPAVAAPKPAVKAAAKTVKKAPVTTKKVAAPKKAAPAKAPAKPAAKPVAKTKSVAKPAAKSAAAKPAKVKKPKMVRDSFTIPKVEFAVLDALKARATKLTYPVKKTELIRAGIKALAAMPDAAFLAAIKAVPNLKTGRPAKS